MHLFVGLGNPGSRYARNRHNVGFMAVDEIARAHGAAPWRRRFQGEAAEAVIGGERVLILKPQTYMNESGRAVAEAQRFFKIPLSDVTVFYDELDLPPAKLRVKVGGGNAGHNGLRSITAHCGNDYRRVRIGIGHPGHKPLVQPWVLGDFSKAEEPWVEDLTRAIADSAALLAKGEDASFQNRIHLAMEAKGWIDVKRPGEKAGQDKNNAG
jgi:peptidyl-tRNA hydrolase